MASRFWVGGAGTWDNSATTHWSASSGGGTGASNPISTDTVTFDTASGLTNGLIVTVVSTATAASTTITMNAVKSIVFALSGNANIGTITATGNSQANRVYIQSDSQGTARTLTSSSVTLQDVDFRDITGAGTATWSGTRIGDALGNTNITTTTPTTQNCTMSVNKNWSDNTIWTSHVPLPQDTVTMTAVTGGTLTADVPRLGNSIDWTGATGSPVWGFTSTTTIINGSITLVSGMTTTGTQSTFLNARSGSPTINSKGVQFTQPISIFTGSGVTTYTLGDDFSSSNTLFISSGFFGGGINANNHNVTVLTFSNGFASIVVMGSGTWHITSTATTTVWSSSNAGAFASVTANTSTIQLDNTTANTRTFTGGGQTYYNLVLPQSSTGIFKFNDGSTFNSISVTGGTGTIPIQFTNGTTTTLTGGGGAFFKGASGNLPVISSSSAGNAFTLSSSFTITTDFISLKDSTASGAINFYAGANSTNVSGNTNWTFTALPNKGTTLQMLGVG